MTRGAVIAALGGRPGETRRLTLEREGMTHHADLVAEAASRE